jgi:hypothetical protein
MFDIFQNSSLNSSDLAHSKTGHCQFGLLGSIEFICKTVTFFIAAIGVF